MPVYFYASWLTSKATDVEIETMIKGYDAIKAKMLEIQAKGYEATNKDASVLECLKLALEASARGIKFKTIDIEKSDGSNFVMDENDNALIMPFRALDGLGDSVAKKMVVKFRQQEIYAIFESI